VPSVPRATTKDNGGIPRLEAPQGYRTLSERAFAAVHKAILSGVLTPGTHLPIEDLAARLEMSPMPVREALRQLDSAGLVENVPHRGARVTELSLADLHEIYEARLALEPLAIRTAAARFDAQDAAAARTLLERLARAQRAKDADATWEAHTAFHYGLYRRSGSQWLLRLITPLWESSERYRRASPAARSIKDRTAEHEAILQACLDRDPDRAAAELHNHLAVSANRVACEMGGDELFALERVPATRRRRPTKR
jgi:DNA-binding GntR family transcriptional regulator